MKKIILILVMVMLTALTFTLSNVSAFTEPATDNANYIKHSKYTVSDSVETLKETEEVTRNEKGLITEVKDAFYDESGTVSSGTVTTYEYNENDQVSKVTVNRLLTDANVSYEKYSYTSEGNLQSID